ncbi:MAG: response regulator [Nitrososphaeraceae archaeon]
MSSRKGVILHLGKKRSNTNILVVDDEQDIVNLIKQSLEPNGFQAYIFIEPSAALEHFISHSKDYDIVISDIRMPGMNGYGFIRNVKENNPKVKVILMTAFEIDDKEFHDVLSDIKLDAFLQKPFHIQQLNEVIEKISPQE